MYDTLAARSGSKWDNMYIESLGIDIKDINFVEMFDTDQYSLRFVNNDRIQSICSLDIFTRTMLKDAVDKDYGDDYIKDFLDCLYNVIYQYPNMESCVDDLGKCILRVSGVNRIKNITINGPIDLWMVMSGETIGAKPDICIETRSSKIILVIQEDKSFSTGIATAPEGQLVAEMVAAFNRNKSKGLQEQIVYGITLLGTQSTFYRMKLDNYALDSIVNGYKRLDSKIATLHRYRLGEQATTFLIESRDNVLHTFQCYEALRRIIEKDQLV